MRWYWAVAVWGLATVFAGAPGLRADQVYGIDGPNTLGQDYFLGVVKGKVRLVKDGDGRRDWVFKETPNGTLIHLEPSKTYKYGGWYLSFHLKGKRKEVFLSKKPGPGSYWSVGRNGTAKDLPYTRTFNAAAGKLKGWTLSAGPKAQKLKDRNGRPFRAYRAVLKKNPKPVPRFYVFSIAP
jgi:hypothetical protein